MRTCARRTCASRATDTWSSCSSTSRRRAARRSRSSRRNVGTPHLCLLTDDLPALYERLVAAGVDTFVSPPVLVDTGFNTGGYGLYLRDPDGILVELFQPAPPR